MSEEILEQTAEELEEEQQAVAESSGEEILDEAKAKVEEDEEGEEEMEEAVSTPKTKAGMIKALYNQLNGMKKSDLSDSFSKIMGSTLAEEDESDEDDEEEEKDTTDTTAPTVTLVSTTANNQSSVSITDNITVTFSEAMEATYVTTSTSDTNCAGTIRVSPDNFSSCVRMSSEPVSSNSNKTFTLDPYDNLTRLTTYLTRVTTGVKDTAGNAMISQYETSSGFTSLSLSTPSNLTATGAAGQVTLDWNAVSGANSYTVYWDNATGISSSSTAITSISTDNYTHSSLDNGSIYYYKVVAVCREAVKFAAWEVRTQV